MGLSAKQAADAVGMTKQGIIKSIRNGRLSAAKDNKGQWQIDPAELFRVYDAPKTVDPIPKSVSLRGHTPENTPKLEQEIVELRLKLEASERRNGDLENQLRKSEQRENKLMEVVQSQTRLLEGTTEQTPPKRKGLFSWLTG